MDLKEFEDVVKKIDKKKYHVGRSLAFDDKGNIYLEKWDIFRKDMSMEEYFDRKNLAILSSENGNTIEDIKNLIKEGKNVNT